MMPNRVCIVEGCGNPAFTDTRGRKYQKCTKHLGDGYAEAAAKRNARKKAAKTRKNEVVEVLVIDWKDDRILRVTGTVNCIESLPKTEADLLDIMARFAQEGGYVAKPHAFRITDLKPDVPERKKKGKAS